jgi:aryl-alcohol dehydrogenase-like predicted oxidoreductase
LTIDVPLAGGARNFSGDLVVSRLGYGAMELAGPPRARNLDERRVIDLLNGLLDKGVTYIDTSIDYGLSETLIGKELAHRRSEFVLASKCACEVGVEHPQHSSRHFYTAECVTAGVEQSLRRLRTDHLDVVQVHGDPTRRELEEGGVVEALLSLQRRGLIRCIGLSSRLPRLAEFVDADYLSVVQVPWSPLQRTNEAVIAELKRAGKSVVARGVTGRGAPAKNWATRPIGVGEGEARAIWERAEIDSMIAGMAPIEFMIRYALTNDDIDVALVATTDPSHLNADVAYAAKGPLDPDLYAKIQSRLLQAGCGPGIGSYSTGGPTAVI